MGIHGHVVNLPTSASEGLTHPSIYKEIGAGERVALSKVAAQKFEQVGRPLRLAIDTSIWLFQVQSGKGKPRLSSPIETSH